MAGPHQKRNTLLRNARKAARLTQGQLAEKILVSEKSVQRWETGQSTPYFGALQALCELFAKTPEELGFGDPEEAQPEEEEQPAIQQPEQKPPREKPRQSSFPSPVPPRKRISPRQRNSRLITAIISTLVAILVSGVVIAAFSHPPILKSDCGQPFSGMFHGSQLDARWQFANPTKHGNLQIDPQGSLSITAPRSTDLNPKYHLNAPRLLQCMTGDFTIQTHLQFSPTMNFQSAGLLLWQDEHTFLRFERFSGLQKEILFNGILFQEEDNKPIFSISPSENHPTSAQSLDLRVQKQGDYFTASWREPGHVWQTEGPAKLHFDSLMVGLDVLADFGADQITATFTSFTVSRA